MKHAPRLALGLAVTALAGVLGRLRAEDPDRGDVPGWVMLTLMSAVLVAGLLLVAQPALEGLFQDAMARVAQN
ncbi:hypothetical protein ACH9EU_12875 [Kocuria sp. M1R5S2]|uniref:hypothetical protein n=1 Tax=Kocuria rhizosphaerae TaxID=3376285 RepID=UPI0037B40895